MGSKSMQKECRIEEYTLTCEHTGTYARSTLCRFLVSVKILDAALFIRGIVVECGCMEPYAGLRRDAELLLKDAEGAIGKVIVVKLNEIGESGRIDDGFVGVWELDKGADEVKCRGERLVRLPVALTCLRYISNRSARRHVGLTRADYDPSLTDGVYVDCIVSSTVDANCCGQELIIMVTPSTV